MTNFEKLKSIAFNIGIKSKRKVVIKMDNLYENVHMHFLNVCLNNESKPEIYCIDPICNFRVAYDSECITHQEIFGRDVKNLLAKKEV